MATKRNLAVLLGGISAVALFLIVNPWYAVDPKSTADQIVTVTFWVSFLALLVVLFEMRKDPGGETIDIEGPAFTRFLFGNSRAGLFWLPVRFFVGFTFLEAGWHKFSGTGWLDGGSALQGYWQHAVAIPAAGAGSPAITFEWYRAFIQQLNASRFAVRRTVREGTRWTSRAAAMAREISSWMANMSASSRS